MSDEESHRFLQEGLEVAREKDDDATQIYLMPPAKRRVGQRCTSIRRHIIDNRPQTG
jgi:hypothetical protein